MGSGSRWAGVLSLVAAGLAAVAGVVASADGDADIVPFFVALTLAGGLHAWSLHAPLCGMRVVAWAVAGGWVVAAVWIGVLLAMYQATCACSYPPRPPEVTYLGLSATVYHLAGVYGGALLVSAATVLSIRRDPPSGGPDVS